MVKNNENWQRESWSNNDIHVSGSVPVIALNRLAVVVDVKQD
jgi:hypothetical protein